MAKNESWMANWDRREKMSINCEFEAEKDNRNNPLMKSIAQN